MVGSWSCYRCLKTTGRMNGTCLICRPCWRAIRAAGLRWCNGCKQAVEARHYADTRMCCLACRAGEWPRISDRANARRRERYQADAAFREARKAEARKQWEGRAYKLRVLREEPTQRPTCADDIIAHLKVFRLTTAELSEATGYTFGTVRNRLWALRRAGAICRTGNKQWVYVYGENE